MVQALMYSEPSTPGMAGKITLDKSSVDNKKENINYKNKIHKVHTGNTSINMLLNFYNPHI